jgi:ring-1,2-phenylacetyl-CoA epoxidase subunit PaaE
MNTVFLNAAERHDAVTQTAATRVENHLKATGELLRSFQLAEIDIGPCVGCFDCWVRSPGLCRIPDQAQEIVHAVANANRVVWVHEVSFGGFGSQIKRVIDRHIPLILPFFRMHEDLTHHQARYKWLPPVVAFGVDHAPHQARERLFRDHVESVNLNLTASSWGALYLPAGQALDDETIAQTLAACSSPTNPSGSRRGAQLAYRAACAGAVDNGARPQRVAILHGSAREMHRSTSRAISEAFADAFKAAGCAAVDIVHATAFARPGQAPSEAAQQLAQADLLLIAAPLYADTLPFLVMRALEMVRDQRRHKGQMVPPARLAAVINCGFPEAEQTRFALELLRQFALEAQYTYAGGWGVGESEVIEGRPVASLGGMARHLCAAISAAGEALVRGQSIAEAVSAEGSLPLIPHAGLRAIGTLQWYWQAHKLGNSVFSLRQRPHQTMTRQEWDEMALKGWARSRPLRVIGRHQETADAVTILFEDPAHDPLRYRAGQYITLEIEIDGTWVRRSYSLCSTPQETELAITVKRVPGGVMSNYIHDRLKVGELVRSFGPAGDLTVEPSSMPRTVVLVAGGSGIVPLLAVARDLLVRETLTQVRLIYGAETRRTAIFGDVLADLAEVFSDRLHYSFVPVSAADSDEHGLLTAPLLERLLAGVVPSSVSDVLLCGPDGMRQAVRSALIALGYDGAHVRDESFVSPRAGRVSEQPQTLTVVTLDHTTQRVTVKPDQTALDAMLDAGMAVPFSCLNGSCGTCTCRVRDGDENIVLDAPNNVSPQDRAAGLVPSCITRLMGPVTLQIDDSRRT